MRKIMFVTGTRADYGKMKPLMKAVESSDQFEAYIYISGMHLIESLGNTYQEVLKDGYQNTQVAFGIYNTYSMSNNLGNTICNMTGYVNKIQPDMIVVHGDRIDAMAGAVVGALNNIKVGHVEGGELSGTIDESIRHAISKFAHTHFVSHEEAKTRLLQLGEDDENIYVIGSPDIDIMLSDNLPSLDLVKERYDIPFSEYGIFMYHPVTTEVDKILNNIKQVAEAVEKSGKNYVVIYPNNDMGSDIIISQIKAWEKNPHFKLYPSIRFEYFLTLLKNAEFMIGNSSGGVREASVYGIPAIDIGSRQSGRYNVSSDVITHVNEDAQEILNAIYNIRPITKIETNFGQGNSVGKFMKCIGDQTFFEQKLQKKFIDFNR